MTEIETSSIPYAPLALPESTRLCKILPGGVTDGVECQVFEYDLRNPSEPGYTALSYCWGGVNKDSSITLNGHAFHVTNNLHAALGTFRTCHSNSLFWIDAICIDQSNLKERSTQVLMMRRIYERASRIVIWLGTGDSKTIAAMHWAERFHLSYTSMASEHGVDKCELDNMCARDVEGLFGSSSGRVDFTPLHGLVQLLSNPWFERVWIIQEVTTPKKDVLVHCGNAIIRWDALVAATEMITRLQLRPELREFFADAPYIDNQSLRRLFNLEKQRQYDKPALRLLQILAKYRHFNATDPRDKIYAIRGLAGDLFKTDIIPDYSLPPQTVFTKVAEHLLVRKRSFECLGFCDYSTRDLKQPSWVPDWSSHIVRHPLAKRQIHDSPQEQPPIYKAGFSPTKVDNKELQWNCSISGGFVLRAAGFCVDVVDRTSQLEIPVDPNPSPPLSSGNSTPQTRSAIYDLEIPDSEMYRGSSEPLKMAYSRAVIADVAKLGNVRVRGYNITLEHWRHIRDYTKPSTEARYRKEWGSLMFSTTGRSLLWSKEKYLGLGPVDAEPGDHICVFFGGDVLYLLRPVNKGFHFVGESYVHGLMDGEAFELLDQGLRKVENFAIL